MIEHLPILPIVFPALMAVLLLLPKLDTIKVQRACTLLSALVLCLISAMLLSEVNTEVPLSYKLGDWPAPYGIELLANHTAAMYVTLCSFLSVPVVLYSMAGCDNKGRYFYPLVLMQIMGINGAFLTNDLFNLFVFFEVLLMASYALVIHGGGKEKTQAAIQYVIVNLVGSAVFLLALAILYAIVGTLNMSDLAVKVGALDDSQATIVKAACGMLLVVFGLKSAVVPLHFWLNKTYRVVEPPIAALFAILTKVGFYSLLKASVVLFGAQGGLLAHYLTPALWPIALLTLSVGTITLMASPSLRSLAGFLVVVSAGTLLLSTAMGRVSATTAGLYYSIHSTLVVAALFLLSDVISEQRGQAEDRLVKARAVAQPVLLGLLFVVVAVILIGMPPFSGFMGKILLLQAAVEPTEQRWVWSAILVSGFITLVVLVRAGIQIFWDAGEASGGYAPKARSCQIVAIILLLAASPLLVVAAGPVIDFLSTAATELHAPLGALND
ncbi:monovalent cation/H+ antiporter subunit D [bacterium]|nr:monovalent cation/H+ antiporter subunit D [bacterium]